MKSKPNGDGGASEMVPGDPECIPASFLCVKVLCGAVIQANAGRRQGLVWGHTHLRPITEFYLPDSSGKQGFGEQGGGSAVAFSFVLADAALRHRSAPGCPSLQVLSLQQFQLPQLSL